MIQASYRIIVVAEKPDDGLHVNLPSCLRQVLTVTTSSAVDSGYFVSGSFDRTCRLWTTDRLFPLRTLVGHNLAVETVQFHPNQTYFATGSADKTVRLWTINDGMLAAYFDTLGEWKAIRLDS